ncbi:hypothetical protein DL764_003680 [Monosporascus ibericus]|uniref:Putative lipoate-protein ligase A n=1 Tax=Monosporascus ibericus TaxID=155417 RepID=A0A4V1XBB0_9PEZI|nr:hypothetical protein DL764_003680 [Monosporascus ibericus]
MRLSISTSAFLTCNPWVEVNLGLVRKASGRPETELDDTDEEDGITLEDGNTVELVRRRSGGGTVFHDLGNVNYSVLCPPADFDRNKHAEMVVRALRGLGATTARVNERHDIVMDGPASSSAAMEEEDKSGAQTRTFKVSGSAYKLTRQRSLHHGTCLLTSPNLGAVGRFLRSPAEPYIKARGVASVRSPIRNVGISPLSFQMAVVDEFQAMYEELGADNVSAELVSLSEAQKVPELMKGYEELRSQGWLYTQTPQFTLSTHPTADDPRPRPALPAYLPQDFRAEITVRHGQITAVSGGCLPQSLVSSYLHEVSDWRSEVDDDRVGRCLNGLLGVGDSTSNYDNESE